jgi:Mlc titration factor MtfA (ptsG expression regulator)
LIFTVASNSAIVLLGLAVVVVAVLGVFGRAGARRRRREAAMRRPFPDAWLEFLEQNLPVYTRLSAACREQLHRYVQWFLAEKRFEGCGGLEVTDEIRVTIAAQACLLLLNRAVACYPRLRVVLVYPGAYVAGAREGNRSVRLGESWGRGQVVLSWDDVKRGGVNFRDGHNVAMHEFAHQLDQEDGAADGAPILAERSAYSAWARVLSGEFEKLQRRTAKGRKTVMDEYGATNPAEFFAVATETFFEKPKAMRKKHPALYEELRKFYRTDPLEWVP